MIRIEAKNEVGLAVADLAGNAAKQAAFASIVAVNRVASRIKTAIIQEMASKFDRPMPITLKSIMVKPANKQKPVATVWLKDGQLDTSKGMYAMRDIIGHEFTGGARLVKRLEIRLQRLGILPAGKYVAPGKAAPLDAYGGIQRGEVTKMLTQLGAWAGEGRQPMSDRMYSRLKKRGQVFKQKRSQYIVKRGRDGSNIGIWKLISKGNVQCVLAFVRKPTYRKRIDFDGIGRHIVETQLPQEFSKAFEQAMASSGKKGAWK